MGQRRTSGRMVAKRARQLPVITSSRTQRYEDHRCTTTRENVRLGYCIFMYVYCTICSSLEEEGMPGGMKLEAVRLLVDDFTDEERAVLTNYLTKNNK